MTGCAFERGEANVPIKQISRLRLGMTDIDWLERLHVEIALSAYAATIPGATP
jgi:hypothetical protein